MLKTLEATLDPEGVIRFREKIRLTRSQRVLVTLLEDDAAPAAKPISPSLSETASPAAR